MDGIPMWMRLMESHRVLVSKATDPASINTINALRDLFEVSKVLVTPKYLQRTWGTLNDHRFHHYRCLLPGSWWELDEKALEEFMEGEPRSKNYKITALGMQLLDLLSNGAIFAVWVQVRASSDKYRPPTKDHLPSFFVPAIVGIESGKGGRLAVEVSEIGIGASPELVQEVWDVLDLGGLAHDMVQLAGTLGEYTVKEIHYKIRDKVLDRTGMVKYKGVRQVFLDLTEEKRLYPNRDHATGTGTPKCYHEVRGHYRFKGTPKEKFIAPFTRGDVKLGMVIKTYVDGKVVDREKLN